MTLHHIKKGSFSSSLNLSWPLQASKHSQSFLDPGPQDRAVSLSVGAFRSLMSVLGSSFSPFYPLSWCQQPPPLPPPGFWLWTRAEKPLPPPTQPDSPTLTFPHPYQGLGEKLLISWEGLRCSHWFSLENRCVIGSPKIALLKLWCACVPWGCC